MKETNLESINFRKNFFWNILGSTLNGFTSLFFLIIVTRINGLSDAGVFTLAFSIACLLYIIGGYAGRVYQVTDINSQFSDKEYIFHRIITCIIMMIVAFSYCVFMQYENAKFLIIVLLCFAKALEAIGDVFLAILQKKGYLYQSGISLTMKAVASIVIFFIVDFIYKELLLSCISLVLVWLIVLLLYDIPNALKVIDKDESCSVKNLSKIFKAGFFAFGVLFLSIYLSNAPKFALDGIASEELQAVFGIILMPATIVGLCAQYLLQPFLNKISITYSEGNKKEFKKTISKLARGVMILGGICLIGAAIIGVPVLNWVYSLDLNRYMLAFICIMVGATFYSLSSLYAAALTTIRELKIQFIIYSIASVFGLILSPILIRKFDLIGASASYLIIMIVLYLSYFITYHIFVKKRDFSKSI